MNEPQSPELTKRAPSSNVSKVKIGAKKIIPPSKSGLKVVRGDLKEGTGNTGKSGVSKGGNSQGQSPRVKK